MTHAGVVAVFIGLTFLVTLLIKRAVTRDEPRLRSPVVWFFSFWLLGTVLLLAPLFHYYEEFEFGPTAVMIGFLVSYCVGDLTASFAHETALRRKSHTDGRHRAINAEAVHRYLFWGIWAGVIGTALLVANSLLMGGMDLSARLDLSNAQAVRSMHMSGEESKIGPLYGPATAASGIGGVATALIMFLRGYRDVRLDRLGNFGLWIWVVMTVFFGMIVTGSRMAAIFGLAIALLGFCEGRWAAGRALVTRAQLMRFWKFLLAAPVALVVLWFLSTYFLEKRVGGQDPERILYTTHRAVLNNDTRNLVGKNPSTKYFLLSMSYFATPIPTLEYYLELPEGRQPGPLYGEYDFPTIARWIRRVTFTADPIAWDLARMEVFRPLGDIGFGTNVWATLPRDLMADFGRPGAAIFLAFLGFVAQRCYLTQRQRPSMAIGAFSVYVRIVVLFSGLVSVLYLPIIQWGLIITSFLMYRCRSMDLDALVIDLQEISSRSRGLLAGRPA